MAFEERPGQGALFKNDRKDPDTQQPDTQGTLTCPFCEQQMRLAGWQKESAQGTRFLSLKASEGRTKLVAKSSTRSTDDDEGVF